MDNNQIREILLEEVEVMVLLNGKWQKTTLPLAKVIGRLDTDGRSIYKCYVDKHLKKEQRQAIRGQFSGTRVYLLPSALRTFKKLIDAKVDLPTCSAAYLKWLYKLGKTEDPANKMEGTDCAMYKIDPYWDKRHTLKDKELVGAVIYQLIRNCTSNLASLTTTHQGAADVFGINDTDNKNFIEWYKFFSSRPGFREFIEDVLSRPEKRTVLLRHPKSEDGFYYISDVYFK